MEFYGKNKMKVLVTGSTGFIGGNIVKKLIENGFEVNVLIRKNSNTLNINRLPVNIYYGDICEINTLIEPMKGCSGLFHAAAFYSFWASDPKIFYQINVTGTKNIIETAYRQGVERIIYTSSESTLRTNPIKNINQKKVSETDSASNGRSNGSLNNGINRDYNSKFKRELKSSSNDKSNRDFENSPNGSSNSELKVSNFKNLYEINNLSSVSGDYKKSKVLAEIEVMKMIEEKMPIIIINPTTPVGPGDVKPTPTGKIVLDYLNRKMPAYVDTGLNIIDVEDVAVGHIKAFQRGGIGKRYILGNKNLTLKQIFEILEKITKIKAPKMEIPLGLAKFFAYMDEFISGKILKKHPKIPLAAVQTACKYRFFDCSSDTGELRIDLTPVEFSFEKAARWFMENGYVNYVKI